MILSLFDRVEDQIVPQLRYAFEIFLAGRLIDHGGAFRIRTWMCGIRSFAYVR